MKRILTASLSCVLLSLTACGMSDAQSSGRGMSADGPYADASPGGAAPGASAGSKAAKGEAAGKQGQGSEQAGQLTAGVWDDNLNFDFFRKYVDLNASAGGVPSFSFAERDAARQKWGQRAGATELDVAFLIDTTGSMGDELSYLQREIDNIASTIATKFQTAPRYGLVLYKDSGDAFVTRSFDFRNVADFRAQLVAQSAGGGGDIPEAVAEGLTEVVRLGWRSGPVARMAFWVADAPQHAGTEQTVRAQIDAAVAKDVHVYPVAASGTDPRAELTMRMAAQMTGGRYVFLTDDSGIGSTHAEPHIPCYHVTKFDGALVRMVESEMTGTHVLPAAADILRTVGDPQDGRCVTQSQTVAIY